MVVIEQDDDDEADVQEILQPGAQSQEQGAGWTSDESEEELPGVSPFRERRQAPTFQMVVGRENRMLRSTGTDTPTQDVTSSNFGPHNYQMRPTVPIVPFTAATSAERVRSQLIAGTTTSR